MEATYTRYGVSVLLQFKVNNWEVELIWVSWVRSWILFRLAIITQGIAARASLGQASSADAKADSRVVFDFFGKMAWESKKDAEKEGGDVAKL